MLKEIILIENNKYYQFDHMEELIKHILGNNYYTLSEEEKVETMEMNARFMCANSNRKILNLAGQEIKSIEEYFVIYDEMTYILSSALTGKYILLQHKDSNIFVTPSEIDIRELKDNYIIINKFAGSILKKYIDSIKITSEQGENQ